MTTIELAFTGQSRVHAHTLNVHLASAHFGNMEPDSLSLYTFREADEEALIAEGDMVTVWKDNEVFFKGRAMETRYSDGEGGPVQKLELRGTWWELMDSPYHRLDAPVGYNLPLSAKLSLSWSFLEDYFTEYMTSVCTFPTWAETGLSEIYDAYPLGVRNRAVSNNVRELVSNFPLSCVRWDYSTTPPTMQVINHNEDEVTLEYGAEVVRYEGLGLQDNRPNVVSLRKDLTWRSIYSSEAISDETIEKLGGFVNSLEQVAFPTGQSEGGPGVLALHFLFDFAPSILDGSAEWLYNYLNTPIWQGSMTLKGQTSIRPGASISLNGAHPDFATMGAVVQSVDIDFLGDTSTLTIGGNELTSAETLVERISMSLRARRRFGYTPFPPSSIDPDA